MFCVQNYLVDVKNELNIDQVAESVNVEDNEYTFIKHGYLKIGIEN